MFRWCTQCLVALVIFSSFAASIVAGGTAQAESSNLVWKPYLQQVTDSSAIVLWATKSGGNPSVAYGGDTSYGATASGSTRTLTSLDYRLHRVKLENLWPNTTYFYSPRTDGVALLPNETLKFTTAPNPDSNTPVTFLAFGDFGQGTTTQRTLRDRMLQESFNFIVTTGDNVYDNGRYSEFDTRMFQIYGDLFWHGGLFPSIGNHDTYTNNAAPYLDLFDLPTNTWRAADQERYYSFDYGSIHVVVLDSNSLLNQTDSNASDDMFDWLRADLSHTTQPWKVAVFHHPPYSTGNSHGSDSRARAKLVPIFEQYGVQLVLNGHDHLYERSKPLRGGLVTTTDNGGITYIVTGAGAMAGDSCGDDVWVAVKICSGGYGIYNRITADHDNMHIEAVRDTGAVVDDLTLHTAGLVSTPTPSPTAPPSSTAIALPGRIEAENYRAGGEGVGYHDTTAGNSGATYRADDVDIEPCSDGTGCFDIGWTAAGEWLNYDVDVVTAGSYTLQARVATKYSGTKLHVELDGQNVSGALAVPNTGDWQTWTTVQSAPISLPAGPHTLRLVWDTANLNVNYLDVVAASSTAHAVPGIIEAEAYNAGGEGIGYHDTTAGNTGGAFRTDDVDIQSCSDGAGCFNVGWTTAGEWLNYDMNVATTGSYTAKLRVATPYSGQRLRLDLDGAAATGWLTVPNTGAWQTWTTMQSAPFALGTGTHTLRLVFEAGSVNVNYLDIRADTQLPTSTATAAPTNTATSTPTSTSTAAPTNMPTSTGFAVSPTASAVPTNTATPTTAPTNTAVPTATSTSTAAPTNTATPTATSTATAEPTSAPTATPSSNGAIMLPGRVQVEDYRAGGEGVGYHDTTSGNNGAAYRADDVDIESCSDGANCFDVGWTDAGEWLAYDVNVATGGSYTWQARVATRYSGKSLHLELDGQNVGTITAPNTGGWQTWTTVQSAPFAMTAGAHTLRLVWDTTDININYFDVTLANSAGYTFPAVADAEVRETSPSSNYGTATFMDIDGSPMTEGFVCFDVAGISGAIQHATLRIYVTNNGTTNGPAVYQTDSTWTEAGLTWSNRPARIGSASDNKGALSTNTWVDYEVTPLVSGNGSACFVLVPDSSDGVYFSTREGSQPAQLVLTTGN